MAWPGSAWLLLSFSTFPVQHPGNHHTTVTKLLFRRQQKVVYNLMDHPVQGGRPRPVRMYVVQGIGGLVRDDLCERGQHLLYSPMGVLQGSRLVGNARVS